VENKDPQKPVTKAADAPAEAAAAAPVPVPVAFGVKAYKLYDVISLKAVKGIFSEDRIQPAPQGFVIPFKKESYLYLFRFGCVAFFNFTEEDAATELARLREALGKGADDPPTESYEIRIGEPVQVEFEHTVVKRLTRDHIAVIALTVAQSAALDFLEKNTEQVLETSSTLFVNVSSQGRLPLDLRNLLKLIGGTVNTRQDIVTKLAILDAPDETWKSKELDKLYRDVRDNFEIDLRFRAVDRKLTLLQDNIELLADLTNYQRANALELLIIALIFIEILLGVTGLLRH
jgi:required for meiotic nuclear division protein 1